MTERETRKQWVQGSALGAGVFLVIALVLIVNYFGWKYHQRFDWTSNELYTLSEKSLHVVQQLDEDVEIIVFLRPGEQLYDQVIELLRRYEASSPRITLRQVDPDRNLIEAQGLVDKYQIAQLNVVVFDRGDDRRVVDSADLADYDYSGMQYGQGPQLQGFKGEQVFTSTLLELMESEKPKIVFTTGHGEAGLDDFSPAGLTQVRDLLGQDNFELEEWAPLGQRQVPQDADLVVVAGPSASFVEPEVAALRAFLEANGRLLLLLNPNLGSDGSFGSSGLEELLAEYGVGLGQDIVVDPASQLPFYGAETIFVNTYKEHAITSSLRQAQLPVILPLARSVRAIGNGAGVGGFQVTELLETSASGWGETDLTQLDRVEQGEGDLAGPVPLAVAVEPEIDEPDLGVNDLDALEVPEALLAEEPAPEAPSRAGARLVVFGDADFLTNGQIGNVGNPTLAANTMNWLVEREALIAIPPKKPEQTGLNLSRQQLSRLTWLVLVILPASAVAAGVTVYRQRRR